MNIVWFTGIESNQQNPKNLIFSLSVLVSRTCSFVFVVCGAFASLVLLRIYYFLVRCLLRRRESGKLNATSCAMIFNLQPQPEDFWRQIPWGAPNTRTTNLHKQSNKQAPHLTACTQALLLSTTNHRTNTNNMLQLSRDRLQWKI